MNATAIVIARQTRDAKSTVSDDIAAAAVGSLQATAAGNFATCSFSSVFQNL